MTASPDPASQAIGQGSGALSDSLARFRTFWAGYPGASDQAVLAHTIERVRRKIDTAIEGALRPLGLSRSRFELLAHLAASQSGSYRLTHLSDLLVLHPASVTSLVDNLVKLGYLRRVPSKTDRRVVLAQITPKGRRACSAGATALAAVGFGLPEVTKDQAKVLRQQLLKLL
jgi:DNA-binding MarR family transcriptional regulator